MRIRAFLPAVLVLASTVAALAAPAPKGGKAAPAAKDAKPAAAAPAPVVVPPPGSSPVFIDGVRDTGQFLADTVVLVRVAYRASTVGDFVRSYFDAYAPDRPAPDSAGRVEFMNSMVNKDLLGLEALAIDRPFGFEDRIVMREHTQRVLSNTLFQRAVVESVTVTDEDVARDYANFAVDVRARRIQFHDPNVAQRVRADLVAGRLRWEDAVRRYSTDRETRDKGGDFGWVRRRDVDGMLSVELWPVKDGGYTRVFNDADGFQLFQALERRPATPPDFNAVRALIDNQLRAYRTSQRMDLLYAQIRGQIGMAYDSTVIASTATHFPENIEYGRSGGMAEITVNQSLPEFTPADTAKVLARWKDGHLSVGMFLDLYSHLSPVGRPSVNTHERLRRAVDNFVLEPYMAEIARQRGLDKDPLAAHLIARKREQILVEHLYEDSVLSKVWIDAKERRAYYQRNLAQYFTYPEVDYAIFAFDSKAGAEALAAKLRAGEDARKVLADSLHGWANGSIRTTNQGEHGPFQKLLFETLRQGQVGVDGPGRDGSWFVLQSLRYDPGRQLSYDEAAQYVDESLQNIRSEERLKHLLERLRRKYPWSWRPELVMRIKLVDPTL